MPERRGRLRGVRGHPRGDEEEGHGRLGARGALPARAAADAAAARQGDRGDPAALQERGARRDAYFDDIPDVKVPKDMLELAEHILETKKAQFDPSKFEDRYEGALEEADQGQAGRQGAAGGAVAEAVNVINLMDALRRSAKGRARRRKAGRARNGAATSARSVCAKKRRQAQEAQEGELSRGAAGLPQEAQVRRDAGAARRQARAAATASSSRSTPRRGCTTICGSSSTA